VRAADDVQVRVVQARDHGAPTGVDQLGRRALQLEHARVAARGQHLAVLDCHGLDEFARVGHGGDLAIGEDQVRLGLGLGAAREQAGGKRGGQESGTYRWSAGSHGVGLG
jgi:hypothetical protein